MDARFTVDNKGSLSVADGQSTLVGRTGYYHQQHTSPDLIVMLRSPALGGIQEIKPRVVLAGDVGGFALQDLIAFLGQSRWSGALKVAIPGSEKSLLIKDGEVRAASSDASADRLTDLMVRLGYITKQQLESVQNDVPPSRIGKALVERNILKAHDLYKCLQEQISEIFHGIMLAKEGVFSLVDQDLDDKALAHNISMSMQGLLMDSIRKIDELAQFRKKIPHGKLFVIPKKPSDGTLEEEEEALLKLVDGTSTLILLAQSSKISEFDATRIVYHLLEGGFVKLTERLATGEHAIASTPSRVMTAAEVAAGVLDEVKVIQVFNIIFKEIRDEVAKNGNLELFLTSANAALKGNGVSASPVLHGVLFSPDGSLSENVLLVQYAKHRSEGHLGGAPLMSLKQALSDVMFFLLFQAGELLESRADEALAKRVKELLSTVESK
jgi:hypothetical protein